jgi:transcriptional regulator with XRE-family HTH domain
VSIGETLADARRQAGLTVAEVSRETRIRQSIIRDIEEGDFSACGGDFYARGHIRSIAGAVGTDPVPLVSEYDAEHGPPTAMRAADVFEPSRPVKIRERHSPSLSLIVVLVLLAIIGFGTYRLVSHHKTAKPTAAPTHSVTASAKPKAHPSASASASARPAPPDVVIKLVANEDCWVLLTKHSDGSQIYMGVVSAGSSMTWTEKQAVDVRLGNPPGVVLTVNGKRQPTNVLNPETLSFSPAAST